MNVDFGTIIKRSFNIAWQYKTLWIFGLFAGGVEGFNTNWTDKLDRSDINTGFMSDIFDYLHIPYDFMSPDIALIGALLVWALALGLLFFICYLIAQPAIIDGVNNITRGGQYSFGSSFSRGADFFWRFFAITLVEIFTGLIVIFTIVILAIILTPFSLLLTLPAAIVTIFFLYHTFALAEVALVARDNQIGDAIAEGWAVLMRNKANCFIMTLVLVGLGIAFGIVIMIGALILYLPINLLVYGITGNVVGILLLAVFIGLPVAIVLGGYTGTFFNALYVQFYFQLVEPPQPAAVTTAPGNLSGPTV